MTCIMFRWCSDTFILTRKWCLSYRCWSTFKCDKHECSKRVSCCGMSTQVQRYKFWSQLNGIHWLLNEYVDKEDFGRFCCDWFRCRPGQKTVFLFPSTRLGSPLQWASLMIRSRPRSLNSLSQMFWIVPCLEAESMLIVSEQQITTEEYLFAVFSAQWIVMWNGEPHCQMQGVQP